MSCMAWCFVGLGVGFFVFGFGVLWVSVSFLWGDQSPHAPPKCAHSGAFHEVVRLGCVVCGLVFRGFGGGRFVFCESFPLPTSHFPLPTSIGGGEGIGTPEPVSLSSKAGCLRRESVSLSSKTGCLRRVYE